MPELPEVQTVINYLKENILNLTIKDIEVKKDKFIKNVGVNEFKNTLTNSKIIYVQRKGKYLIFECKKDNKNFYMINHLRMEGKFFIDQEIVERKHDYIIFHLSNKHFLSYNDSRQFGTFHLTDNLETLKEINKVAIDPLDDRFNETYFFNKINKSNKNIKAILLDQSIVSGIGNIYASEILFLAQINPFMLGKELTKSEISKIIHSSKKILEKAIKYNGTTIHTFSFGDNKIGQYNQFLKVIYQEHKICKHCNNAKIERIKQQGRSTYFCPRCQNVKMPK